MQIQVEALQQQPPLEFLSYVHEKTAKNITLGRPNFLSLIAREGRDPKEELLNICEQAWIKGRRLSLIAKDYGTTAKTIYNLLRDIENLELGMKDAVAAYIRVVPRRKRWYLKELDQSDYDTVQNYIRRAKRDGLKNYRNAIRMAKRAWMFLKYKDPAYWTADEVCKFLSILSNGAQSGMLDAIRQVAPQIAIKGSKDQIQTGRFREKLSRRKKDLFGNELNMIHAALDREKQFRYHKTVFDLHVTLGAREGSADPNSGLAGLTWDRFKKSFSRVDLYESKVRGGIWWRDCPLDLFFQDLPGRLADLWTERGRPTTDKVLRGGYKELTQLYKTIQTILRIHYQDTPDPSLLQQFTTLKPHDADKIHVNLLWEAEIPLEVVAGQFLGQNEGIGLMGRGWLDINVIKKYYLSLTQRSTRFRKLEKQVHTYSKQFCASVEK
jgi:DNA-binding CsgD family transcriptional regulator